MSKAHALQQVAIAVATILDESAAISVITEHGAPQCLRLGSPIENHDKPIVVFQSGNARVRGGLGGSYLVDVELYAIANDTTTASNLLAMALDELNAVNFANEGLDAIPEVGAPGDAEALDPDDLPFPESVGVAATLTLAVVLTS